MYAQLGLVKQSFFIKKHAYRAFSNLFNNWAVTEYTGKDGFFLLLFTKSLYTVKTMLTLIWHFGLRWWTALSHHSSH